MAKKDIFLWFFFFFRKKIEKKKMNDKEFSINM